MNLLSDSVYWLAAALTVVALVGAAWVVAHLPRGTWRWLLNVPVVALASALIALSAGLVLNRQNAWYTSWGDLFGTATGSANVVVVGEHKASSVFQHDHRIVTTDFRALPPLPSPGSRVQKYMIPTSVGHNTWEVQVILPQDYEAPGNLARAYPVLMAAHGAPGSPSSYLDRGRMPISKLTDPSVAQHRVAPFITVIPALLPGGMDNECVFGPGGADQLETWLSVDVPKFIKAHLRVIQERTGWAWLGYSAGGWCAAMETILHPGTFAAAAVLSGYFTPWWGAPPPFTANSPQDQRLNLGAEVQRTRPRIALWVQSSKPDTESYPSTKLFLSHVRPPTLVQAVIDSTGGHRFPSWTQHVPQIMIWLGQNVPGFAPNA